jgi:hypothetical protein
MRKAEIDLLKTRTSTALEDVANKLLKADKQYKSFTGFSIIESMENFFIPVSTVLKSNTLTDEEAEQLHLFNGEEYTLTESQKRNNNALKKLWEVFTDRLQSKITINAQKNPARYAKIQIEIFNALSEYSALLFIQEALETIGTKYRTLTKETFIAYTLQVHAAIHNQESIKGYFNAKVNALIADIITLFLETETTEKALLVPKLDIKSSTMLLSKPFQKIRDIETAMQDPFFKDDIAKYGGVPVNVAGNNTAFNVYVSITDTMLEELTSAKINEFDKSVFRGICNALDSTPDIKFLTEKTVFDAMNIPGKLTPTRKKKIAASLNKMRQKDISILCTAQKKIYAKQKKPKHIEDTYTNYMFPAACYTRKIKHPNGKEEEATVWEMLGEPPMYKYNNDLKQKRTFKAKDIALPDISITDNIIILRDSILERIAIAEYRNNTGNYSRLNYEMLFQKLQTDEAQPLSREEKRRAKLQIKKILDIYKANGLIATYTEYTAQTSNKVRGIQITTPLKKQKK